MERYKAGWSGNYLYGIRKASRPTHDLDHSQREPGWRCGKASEVDLEIEYNSRLRAVSRFSAIERITASAEMLQPTATLAGAC
jgi:hypothetical protein